MCSKGMHDARYLDSMQTPAGTASLAAGSISALASPVSTQDDSSANNSNNSSNSLSELSSWGYKRMKAMPQTGKLAFSGGHRGARIIDELKAFLHNTMHHDVRSERERLLCPAVMSIFLLISFSLPFFRWACWGIR